MYLWSPRISSKINKKKYLLGLKTKYNEEVWKAIKEKNPTNRLSTKKRQIIYKQFLTADFSAKTVKVRTQ